MKKTSLLMFAILLVAAGCNNSPTVQPSPTTAPQGAEKSPDTNAWKTYQNLKFSFEIKYPPTAAISTTERTQPRYFGLDIALKENETKAKRASEKPNLLLSLAAYEQNDPKKPSSDCPRGSSIENLTLDGLAVKKCVTAEKQGQGQVSLLFSKDGQLYYSIKSSNYLGANKKTIDAIISSFRFVKRTSVTRPQQKNVQAAVKGVVTGSAFPISSTPDSKEFASIAFDGTNYLVVWNSYRSSGGPYQVWAARVSPEGTVLDPKGILLTEQGSVGPGSVAFDGTNYLVVWDTAEWENTRIMGTRLDREGKILDPDGITISGPEGLFFGVNSPAVAFNGQVYFVVWQKPGSTTSGVYGARVDREGNVIDAPRIAIAEPDSRYSDFALPQIATNGSNFLIAWRAISVSPMQGADVRGSRISSSGAVLDPLGIDISTAPGYQEHPSVDYDGSNYLVTWDDTRNLERGSLHDIYAARVNSSGVVVDPNGIAVATGPTEQSSPVLAFDGTNHLIVWWDGSGFIQVWGTHVSRDGRVIEPRGFQIYADDNNNYSRHVAFGTKNGLVVWQHTQDSNIWGKLVELSP